MEWYQGSYYEPNKEKFLSFRNLCTWISHRNHPFRDSCLETNAGHDDHGSQEQICDG